MVRSTEGMTRADKKSYARNAVAAAVAAGKLVRGSCEECGAVPAEGHHDDYDKPLSVRWLCSLHHRRNHPPEAQSITSTVRVVSLRELRDIGATLDEPVFIVGPVTDGFREKIALWIPMWLVDE